MYYLIELHTMKKIVAVSFFMLLFCSSAFAQSTATASSSGTVAVQPAVGVSAPAPAIQTSVSHSRTSAAHIAPAGSAKVVHVAPDTHAQPAAAATAHSECNSKLCPGGACHKSGVSMTTATPASATSSSATVSAGSGATVVAPAAAK